jgi:glycosyltransferase involved in cell wall biosynthesis
MASENKVKKILMIQPNFKAVSEVWLERMNLMLKNQIVAIGAFNPSVVTWEGITIFNLYGNAKPFIIRVLNKLGIQYFDMLHDRFKTIKKHINNPETEIIFIHFIGPAIHFMDDLISSKKKLVIHCHGSDVFWNTTNLDGSSFHPSDYISKINKILPNSIFIANSEFTKQQLLKIRVPENKIRLKYFGVPLKEEIVKYYFKDKINILYLGRLIDFKNPDIVIKAFIMASDNGLYANLVIAGDGELRITCEILKRQSKYSDRIQILGAVDYFNAEKLYQWADIYTMHNTIGTLSNNQETFGVSIIEAMSFGLPVITADSGAISETVINKVTGIVVEPFNVKQHADAFIQLADNGLLRVEMGKAARECVRKHFTLQQEKEQLFEILELE